ncbi:hypothetical protein [Levilactobacillus yiduensis]|uniref:hypothetical protein n=1 Tax=Levilactobacillus yiduensis TaxID=2953880 RepID=UPI0021586A2B|nr:hypothetical protein [Levilactobacillus yiduensis]
MATTIRRWYRLREKFDILALSEGINLHKLLTGTILALGLAIGVSGTTTAQAAKWTTGTPKVMRGVWYAKPRVQRKGHDTTVTNNAMILTPKWLYVMYDYGNHDYGGNRLAYRKTGKQYRLRAYDRLDKTWSYTKLQRTGKTVTLQKYGTKRAGHRFIAQAGKSYQLQFQTKMSAHLLAK